MTEKRLTTSPGNARAAILALGAALACPLTIADGEAPTQQNHRIAAPLAKQICGWVAADDTGNFRRAMGDIQRSALRRGQHDLTDRKLAGLIRCGRQSLRDYAESVEADNILVILPDAPDQQFSRASERPSPEATEQRLSDATERQLSGVPVPGLADAPVQRLSGIRK